MIILLISGAAALAVLIAMARRAPVATLLGVCALGGSVQLRLVPVPSAIGTPVAHLSADVQAWQAHQAATLACDAAQMRALDGASGTRSTPACPAP